MQNASSTDEPNVVTFAHAMSTPSRSNTAVSIASRPARSVVRICTTSSPGEVPSNTGSVGGAGTGLIGTAAGTSPARVVPLRGVTVTALQRGDDVEFTVEGEDELLAQQLCGRWRAEMR